MSLSDKKNHSFIPPSAQGKILCQFSPDAVTVATKPPASLCLPSVWYPSHAPHPYLSPSPSPQPSCAPYSHCRATRELPDLPKDPLPVSTLARHPASQDAERFHAFKERGRGCIDREEIALSPSKPAVEKASSLTGRGLSCGRKEEDERDWLLRPCLLPLAPL